MPVRIGKMREQIAIQKTTWTQSTVSGEQIEAVSTVSSCLWCNVEPRSGQEFFDEDQRHGRVQDRFTVRYTTEINSNLTQKGKIIWNSRTWDIKQIINPDVRNTYLFIDAEVVVQ